MHRRFGKTVMAINHLLRDAILNTQVNPRYAYIAPTYRQAKMIAWDYLKQFAGTIRERGERTLAFTKQNCGVIYRMVQGLCCWVQKIFMPFVEFFLMAA